VSTLKYNEQNIVNLCINFLKCNMKSRNQQNTVNCVQYSFKSLKMAPQK